MKYIKYRDALRELSNANTDNAFQNVMDDCRRSFLAGKMTIKEFNAICYAASVLNFISYCFYAKRISKIQKEGDANETLA